MRSANFVEETTTSIAGSGGNGAITLSAVTGRPRFSTVFGTQATTIRYVIEDTATGKFETGVGVVSANVLTRTRPQVTWDGATYSDAAPAPIAFGSAPASGNIRVRMAATAEAQGVTMPGRNTTVYGSGSWQFFPVTGSHQHTPGFLGGGFIGADVERYSAYRLDAPGRLTGVQSYCNAAAAGAVMKWGLYSCGRDGLPGQKIVDFNPISLATTGFKTDTAVASWVPSGPVWLVPGWYYIGFICNSEVAKLGGATNDYAQGATPLGPLLQYGYANVIMKPGSFADGLPPQFTPTDASFPDYESFEALPGLGLRVES